MGSGADREGYGLNSELFVYMSKDGALSQPCQSFYYSCDDNCVQLTSHPTFLHFLSFLSASVLADVSIHSGSGVCCCSAGSYRASIVMLVTVEKRCLVLELAVHLCTALLAAVTKVDEQVRQT